MNVCPYTNTSSANSMQAWIKWCRTHSILTKDLLVGWDRGVGCFQQYMIRFKNWEFSVELNLVLYYSRRCWCMGGSAWPVVCRSYGAGADLMVLVHEICISVCRVDCTLRMQDARPGQQIVHKGAGTQKLNAVKLRLALSPFLLLFLLHPARLLPFGPQGPSLHQLQLGFFSCSQDGCKCRQGVPPELGRTGCVYEEIKNPKTDLK